MPQRTEFAAVGFRSAPVGCIVGSTPGAYEPLGEFATWYAEQRRNASRGACPALAALQGYQAAERCGGGNKSRSAAAS